MAKTVVRSHGVMARFTEHDFQRVAAKAKAAHQSIGTFVTMCALSAVEGRTQMRSAFTESDQALMRDLKIELARLASLGNLLKATGNADTAAEILQLKQQIAGHFEKAAR